LFVLLADHLIVLFLFIVVASIATPLHPSSAPPSSSRSKYLLDIRSPDP
jgi:hypothetical protein